MLLFVFVVLASFVIALARGGRLGEKSTMRAMWMPPVALLLQLINLWATGMMLGGLITVAAYMVAFGFVALNVNRTGLRILLIGSLLNFLVIVANGGRIPVDADAARYVGLDPQELVAGQGIKHALMNDGSRLAFLGDVVPVPVVKRVFSIGDLFVFAGAFIAVQELMEQQRGKGIRDLWTRQGSTNASALKDARAKARG